MKVLIEVPDNWLDVDSPTIWASRSIADQVKAEIKEQVTKQYLSKVELPEIKFTPEELRQAVKIAIVDRLAEKATEELRKD